MLVALALFTACAGAGPSRGSGDFALRDMTGRTVRLSDHLGDVVLIHFWATWCPTCSAEMTRLERLYQAERRRGLVIIAVSIDGPETIANVAPFVNRNGLTYPVVVDEDTTVSARYNPRKLPSLSVLVARDGRVIGTYEGFDRTEKELVADLRAALDAPPPR